jgi:hypothetical protein
VSIYVWRLWKIHLSYQEGYELRGLYDSPWLPGQVKQAECKKRFSVLYERDPKSGRIMMTRTYSPPSPGNVHYNNGDEIPVTNCTCGIYGHTNDALSEIPEWMCGVLGIAEIWGKVIVGELGYRAQYGTLRALVNQLWPKTCGIYPNQSVIAKDYGVPLLPTVEYAQREFFA